VHYSKKTSEKENAKFRRSLYFVKDICQGEVISQEYVKSIRPGYGLAPKYYHDIIGKKVSQDVSLGTAVKWDHIDK
jgi:N-acetylneuraminate synthase